MAKRLPAAGNVFAVRIEITVRKERAGLLDAVDTAVGDWAAGLHTSCGGGKEMSACGAACLRELRLG